LAAITGRLGNAVDDVFRAGRADCSVQGQQRDRRRSGKRRRGQQQSSRQERQQVRQHQEQGLACPGAHVNGKSMAAHGLIPRKDPIAGRAANVMAILQQPWLHGLASHQKAVSRREHNPDRWASLRNRIAEPDRQCR
jgi:hypothetical protein